MTGWWRGGGSAVVKSWEKVNAGTAAVKDGLWVLLVRFAECLFFFSWDDRLLFHMCNSAQFPGYKQTLPGCMLVEKEEGAERWQRLKWRRGEWGGGRENEDVEEAEEQNEWGGGR